MKEFKPGDNNSLIRWLKYTRSKSFPFFRNELHLKTFSQLYATLWEPVFTIIKINGKQGPDIYPRYKWLYPVY